MTSYSFASLSKRKALLCVVRRAQMKKCPPGSQETAMWHWFYDKELDACRYGYDRQCEGVAYNHM